ncbi:MAG: hypothetical protein EHM87_18525 [Burkholderiales bacterium]|nr:MAG: hypothetical protein EHM87_18525 [Burkholderiales bacterium]
MATLQEQFEQAQQAARVRREAPQQAQAHASFQRLDELHAEATSADPSADPSAREAAIRAYIQLAGDLGQQGG